MNNVSYTSKCSKLACLTLSLLLIETRHVNKIFQKSSFYPGSWEPMPFPSHQLPSASLRVSLSLYLWVPTLVPSSPRSLISTFTFHLQCHLPKKAFPYHLIVLFYSVELIHFLDSMYSNLQFFIKKNLSHQSISFQKIHVKVHCVSPASGTASDPIPRIKGLKHNRCT